MDTRCFIFCFVLFAAVSSYTVPESYQDSNNGSEPQADSSKCKCENGRCGTDNQGNVKCICQPGFAHVDERTCRPCDCGTKGKCLFTLTPKSDGGYMREKKCVCDVGSAEKNGRCIDCYCGDNSACEFNGEEKNCYCIDGFSEKDGVCTRCDCGFYGNCEFQDGNKKCHCDDGYLELDGTCEECDCGENAVSCRFLSGSKTCTCKWKYAERYGRCEECDCGDHGTCSFIDGAKYCYCEDGYKDNGGVCEVCDCGSNSVGCSFSSGVKTCDCKVGFADRNGNCEACDCGPNSAACRFVQNKQTCSCKPDYVQRGNTCEEGCSRQRCQNGGTCENGYCSCLPGTSGDFCEVIEGCDSICPKQKDIGCAYDTARQKGHCTCADLKLRYDSEIRQCHRACNETAVCTNGGNCRSTEYDRFCRCRSGTEGDFCEKVPECDRMNCGTQADCMYSLAKGKAVCQCQDTSLSFDPLDRRCKNSCSETAVCRNGGSCSFTEYDSFCRCRSGTEGDFCEQVPECDQKNCGVQADCRYGLTEGRAVCQCKNTSLLFDPRDTRCKYTCQDDTMCRNGATCRGSSNSKFCDCLEGTDGHFCEIVMGCGDMDCGTDADCVYDVSNRKAVCSCRESNKKFDVRTKTCKRTCDGDSNCNNGGKCYGEFCECLAGTTGELCEIVPGCSTMDCGIDARCTYSVDRQSAVCTCVDERKAFDEVDKTCKRGCSVSDRCQNSGSCRRKGQNTFCDCPKGTKGDLCEVVTDCEEGRTRCRDGATCVFDQKNLNGVCACPDGRKRYDVDSEKCKLTCTEDASCRNGGLCKHRSGQLFCECKKGTSGDLCEKVNQCDTDFCGKRGNVNCVYDVERETAVCICKNRQQQFDPETKTCKECDCGKNAIFCRLEDGKKVCACLDGYESENGTCKKVRCTEKICQNGICQVVDDEEICSCYEGYELDGDYCRKLNCSKTSCFNGTCIVRRGNQEECICQAGYTLRNGYCIRGACRVDTCFGGRCDIVDGELMCVCPKNYSLQGVGCFATVCKKQYCFGGWCVVNENMEEVCTCHEGYVLENDVCKKILCNKPCFGGQCKIVDGKEECTCPEGYSIYEGVCRANNRGLR